MIFSPSTFSQSIEPVALAGKIFSKYIFPDLEKYTAGEYQGRPKFKQSRFIIIDGQ